MFSQSALRLSLRSRTAIIASPGIRSAWAIPATAIGSPESNSYPGIAVGAAAAVAVATLLVMGTTTTPITTAITSCDKSQLPYGVRRVRIGNVHC